MRYFSKITENFFKGVDFYFDNKEKKIFLTFDDGPNPKSTTRIISMLEKHSAGATFFVTGKHAENYPNLLDLIRDKGHTVANHGFEHFVYNIFNKKAYLNSILKGQKITNSRYFRPPYGKIFPGIVKKLKSVGIDTVLWSVNTKDYLNKNYTISRKSRIINQIKSGDIILLHDNPEIVDNSLVILEEILARFSEKGFKFENI